MRRKTITDRLISVSPATVEADAIVVSALIIATLLFHHRSLPVHLVPAVFVGCIGVIAIAGFRLSRR